MKKGKEYLSGLGLNAGLVMMLELVWFCGKKVVNKVVDKYVNNLVNKLCVIC